MAAEQPTPETRNAPFYEQRWFQGTVAVVGLLGAIWAFSGAPKPWDAATRLTAVKVAHANTQIILDASAGMAAPFGKGTKLDAATEAIRKYVVPLEEEGLSLRRTGRSCDEGGELLVDFGPGHGDDIVDAAVEQRAEGESSLAYAVIEAIEEFTATGRFQGPAATKQVVIITGAATDACLDNAPAEIRRKLEDSGIDATFKVVALKATGPARQQLKSFTTALGEHAEVEFVETEEELEEVVDQQLQTLTAEFDEPLQLPIPTDENEPGEETTEETIEEPGETPADEEPEAASGGGTEPEPEPEVEESEEAAPAPDAGAVVPGEEAAPVVP